MKLFLKSYGLLIILPLLHACAANTGRVSPPVPVEDRSVINNTGAARQYPSSQDALAGGSGDVLPGMPGSRGTEAEGPPMVLALLEDASRKSAGGDDPAAAAILERALRIDATNGRLWHQLGLIRLRQKNWQQAINLAKKSNSLAAGDYALQKANWQLMAQAYAGAGNRTAAQAAAARAGKIDAGADG